MKKTSIKEFFSREKENERDIESNLYFDSKENLWNASCSVLTWVKDTSPKVKETWGKGDTPEEAMQDAVDNWLYEFESE